MTGPALRLTLLPDAYAIARLAPDAPVPDWAKGRFTSLTRTEDELSITTPEARIPPGVEASRGWRAFRVDTLADLDTPGVALAAIAPVSTAGLGVFLVSTALRDYLLVNGATLDRAIAALRAAGHTVTG